MPTDLQLAYFAGLIDGEGHIGLVSIGRPGQYQPIIQVKMTCHKTIMALQSAFGGSTQTVKPAKEHYKEQYKWRVRYSNVEPLLLQLRPFLLTKAADADKLLAYLREKAARKTTSSNLSTQVQLRAEVS